MREDFLSSMDRDSPVWAGKLLVSNPGLNDPDFHRSVIFISAHSEEEGAMGVVLNRPSLQTFNEVATVPCEPALESVPVFHGGPVSPGNCLLSAFKSIENDRAICFYLGLSMEKLGELVNSGEGIMPRAFIGYSGWSAGQLEQEIAENAWILCPLDPEILRKPPAGMWKVMCDRYKPEWSVLARIPDDPSLN
jgi:putative transcriptional regulator